MLTTLLDYSFLAQNFFLVTIFVTTVVYFF